jgi:hypothetical protein
MSERERPRLKTAYNCAGIGNYYAATNYLMLEVEDLLAELEQAEKEQDRLREFLAEIESFPVSGYHAAQAQQMARAALGEAKQ